MTRYLRQILATLALACVGRLTGVAADSPGTPAAADAQQASALAALDRVMAQFGALVARDDDAAHRAAAQAVLDDLRKRCEAIHAAFDQAKYDELRVDLNLEYQRMAAWMAKPITPPLNGKKPLVPEISVFQLDPDPADAAGVKAALEALDREIQRDQERSATAGSGPATERARKRLDAVTRLRAELGKEFTRSRWQAVVRELKR